MSQTKHAGKSAPSSATIDRYVKAGFGDHILPIIPHDAKLSWGSKVSPKSRGKVPGRYKAEQDKWIGYVGWVQAIIDEKRRAEFATYPTRNWGLRGEEYVGIDIDTTDATLAKAIEDTAIQLLGPSPARGRANSERRLLVYRAKGILFKRRAWTMPGSGLGEIHAVEILGRGRQYLVEGIHPSGKPYKWRGGRDLPTVGKCGLTETTGDKIREFLAVVDALIAQHGGTMVAASQAGTRRSGETWKIDDPRLVAEDKAEAVEALKCIPCEDLDYFQWLRVMRAFKAAVGGDEQYYPELEEWSAEYAQNTEETTREKWDSFNDSAIGDDWLFREACQYGFTGTGSAYYEFRNYVNDNEPAEPSPEPLDLFGDATLAGQPVLARDALPETLAAFVFDTAERMGVEPGMMALPALAVCAAALDDGIRIQPRVLDTTWTEPPIIWGAIIADPGLKKSPVIAAAVGPLRAIEGEWIRADAAAFAFYEQEEEARKQAKKKGDPAEPKRQPPPRRRAIVNNATVESISEILKDNARGALGEFDELVSLIGSFDAYREGKTGKDRAEWLSLWNGGPRMIDRIARGIGQYIPNWGASVIGGIQPEKMRQLASKLGDDGLLQRFMVINGRALGQGQDRAPDMAAIEGYRDLVRRLVALTPCDFLPAVKLTAEAQRHRQRVSEVAELLKELPDTPAAMRGHLSKWDGMFARLLLVFHVIEAGQGVPELVAGDTAARAARFMLGYVLPHTAAFYGEVIGHGEGSSHARWIAGFILANKLTEISQRDIYRAYRELRGEEGRQKIARIMALLYVVGWVEPVFSNRGKPTDKWTVNPAVHTVFAERAGEEQERREAMRAKLQNAASRIRELLKG
jgi:hypothetical protein